MKTIEHEPQPVEESRPEIGLGEQVLRGLIVLAVILAVFATVHFS